MNKAIIAISLTLFLSGCSGITSRGTFSAPSTEQLPNDQVAILKVTQEKGLGIAKVDDQSVGCSFLPRECPAEVRLLPGRHVVFLAFANNNNQSANGKLWFPGEAGKTYVAKFKRDRWRVLMWIEDAATGEHVGGISE